MDSEVEPKIPDANTLKVSPKVRKKAAKRKTVKPKAKKKPAAKKKKVAKVARKAKRKSGKSKVRPSTVERSERLDMRLTKAEKSKVLAKAKRLRRTVTSVVIEAIEKIK